MQKDILMHYGTPRHSGRYPWGSGENPYQHEKGFAGYVNDLKRQGFTEKEIAEGLGFKSTTELRARQSIESERWKSQQRAQVIRLKEQGMSNVEIGKRLNMPDTTVGNYLKPVDEEKKSSNRLVADVLERQLESKPYLDIGTGVERQLAISKTKLNTAAQMLKDEGKAKIQFVKVEQATNPDKFTTVKVLTKPDVEYPTLIANRDKIQSPQGVYFEDNGRTARNIETPRSISSDRIKIRYAEEGGVDKDGVIEIRPGVEDISLGQNRYAQVRIAVDGTHYLKGMAIYNNRLPKGTDIVFNTNKHSDVAKMDVLKKMSDDPDNPFGSTIRQNHYTDKDGNDQLSAINIVNDETDWGKWKNTLSSQFLSKQSPALAERQLNLAYSQRREQFEELKTLTNPVIKRRLLQDFADDCDSASVHLKAAALPRQATHVILPVTSLKDDEIYAPNYRNGEEVVLIRHPHGGIFEIPRLKVNNNNKEAKEVLGTSPRNAVGINSHVAEQLSGADFDGDTVLVIPTRGQKIKNSSPLEGLKDFNPKDQYRNLPGAPETSAKNGFDKQRQMGQVTNLITDMTIKGATADELAAAVRHSMVIIDAEKHNLDWRQSEIDNGIRSLKAKYQGGPNSGSSTIISRAKSQATVPQRKDFSYRKNSINPDTGEKIFEYTGEEYPKKGPVRKDGTQKITMTPRTTDTTKMDKAFETGGNAYDLLSDDPKPIEKKYAEYANKVRALGNEARKEWYKTDNIPYSKSAKQTYSKEVADLNSKIANAELNAPKERQAQLIARVYFEAKLKENPNMEKDEQKKIRAQSIAEARTRTGASGKESRIHITDREWEAIQAGAISSTKLESIARYADMDELKERATPRTAKGLTPSKLSMARAYLDAGYTQAEVADRLGISTSTLSKALNN